MEQAPDKWEVKYVKSSDFKSFFSTGIIGGVTLNGLIDMNFFIDTKKIPEKVMLEIKDGKLNEPKVSDIKEWSSTREMFVGVLIDVNTARVIRDWLNGHIITIETEVKKQIELKKPK